MATNITNTATGQKGYQVPGSALPAGWTSNGPITPSQVSNTINQSMGATVTANGQLSTGGAANPKDLPGYVPGSSPNDHVQTTTPVTTNQPSPTTVNATPATNAVANATNTQTNTQTNTPSTPSGISGDAPLTGSTSQQAGQAVDQLKQKYGQALSDITKSGVDSPTTYGAASSGVTTALNNQKNTPTYDTTKVDAKLADNQAHQQYLNDYAAGQEANVSRDNLETTYNNLSNELGLPALNSKLMNIQSVIDGTQQDIRNEVSASGGFATESQVQALANARNTTMIQQQKELTNTRDNLEKNLTTMMGLAEKDQEYARQQINDQLNFDQKQIEYADKAVTNGQDQLKNIASSEGWGAVYQAALATGDPQAVQRINALMGNDFDLTTAAKFDTTSAKNRLDLQKTQADLINTQINTQKTAQELNDAKGLPNPAKAGQPGYTDSGVKYSNAVGTQEVNALITQNGLTGTRGLLAPADYNRLKSSWVQNGLKDTDFDSIYGGMKDPSLASKHTYN